MASLKQRCDPKWMNKSSLLKPLNTFNRVSRSFPTMPPSLKNNWKIYNINFGYLPEKPRIQITPSIEMLSWKGLKFKMPSWRQSSSYINKKLKRTWSSNGSFIGHKSPNSIQVFIQLPNDKDLSKLRLATYAHAFPNFIFLPFVGPSSNRTQSRTWYRIVSMVGAKEWTITTMEVDSITTKVATKST
jgi:hypothetical protein